ncbi:MAG TPA: hypothetical protein VGP58_13410 [Pyrinomonadaceae bacterium]|jgi:hypothetical protein|nr:hypothetical protein [Pyrinomonadaceae bacterium]
MKLQKYFLVLIILLASLQICYGQENPQAIKVDEFGKANCEDFWARFDNFFNDLQNDPTSMGYIIIYGEKNSLRANLGYEKLTNGIVRFRNLDSSRLVIIRGEEKDAIHIEFWRVPAGAETPAFVQGNWDLTVKQNKPFILGGYSEGDGICPTNTSVKLFADYLTANPNMRAHIVITDKPTENFANAEKDLLNQLVNEYRISPNRLKFFYVKDKKSPYEFADVEFWLIPQKKK